MQEMIAVGQSAARLRRGGATAVAASHIVKRA